MSLLEKGAHQAIRNCLKVKENESLTIVTDIETLEVAVALLKEAKFLTKNIHFFIAEDFGERPLESIPGPIKDAAYSSDICIIAMQGKPGELENFRKPLLRSIRGTNRRIANMININQEIMQLGMNANYKKVQEFSAKVYDILSEAIQIQVKTPKGTNLLAEFTRDFAWIVGDGLIRKGEWRNLPDGEVYTCPANVSGKIVIDGILGDYFSSRYGLLEKTPLTVEIVDGRAVKASCSNKELEKDFLQRIKADENASRVGEFALGTNIYVRELIGRLLQDEKHPGVHIAFGHGYPEKTGSGWDSKVHIDAVIKNPAVFVDGKKIMESGEYLI